MNSTKEEINKYLTEEVFQECWHTVVYPGGKDPQPHCCDCKIAGKFAIQHDFFTNEGCMILWLKIQEKDWFYGFWPYVWNSNVTPMYEKRKPIWVCETQLTHPDRLAPAVYEFLKEAN